MPRWLFFLSIALLALFALLYASPLDSGKPSSVGNPWSHGALRDVIGLLTEGKSEVTDDRIHLRGVAASGPEWFSAFDALRVSMSDDVDLVVDVFVIDETISVDDLCRRMFDDIDRDAIGFRKSGSEIRTASFAALDRLAGFATDCPAATISITGHTDVTGYEPNNRALSLARAQAVADYLVSRGTGPDRLLVSGVGSSQPVADNDTARGRERNRRIEIGLGPPRD
ncbi:MAG: OmpA family protein [Woeseiaceae bacterium]